MLGSLMKERSVEYALAKVVQGSRVSIKEADYGLGIERWEVGPLLKAVISFLESI
jgi:hypothetical protein